MNDLFFSLVDFSPVVCLEIGSRDDSICLNFSIKKVLCVLFFFVVSIPVTRALQEVVYFIFHTSVSHVSLHVIVISFCFGNFLFFFLVFCCLSLWALADCLFPYIGKIVARSDYLARKLKIKATGKRTKRNKLK